MKSATNGGSRDDRRDIVIDDEELKQFHDWLQMKGDHPSVVLALRWIAEFEEYAEQDEEDFRDLKAHLQSSRIIPMPLQP
jgi:hypothetical protein